MKKLAIAGASVALAALPIMGVFADDTSVVDTIQITVSDTCTIVEASTTDGLDNKDTTYAATLSNGQETSFASVHSGNHLFTVNCNDKDGWSFSATPTDLTGYVAANNSTTNGDSIAFIASSGYTAAVNNHEGTDGVWTATISATGLPSGVTIAQPSTAGSSNTIITATGAQAGGVEITADYQAYVGTETAAGFYEGTITYALAAL